MLSNFRLWPLPQRSLSPKVSVGSEVIQTAQLREGRDFDVTLKAVQTVRLRSGIVVDGLLDDACLAEFIVLRSCERVQRILSIFVEDLASKIARLEESIRNGNAEELGNIAHSVRGSSMLVGAAGLARESQDLEDTILNSGATNWDAAMRLVDTMRNTCVIYREFLTMDF